MFYNYSYFEEETTPKDEHVEEEIEILLEQINNEKRKVMADLYNEKIRIDPEEREKEGKTINDLTCENHETRYNSFIQFSRNKKINTEIRNGDWALLTVNNTDIIDKRCKIHRITSNSVSIRTEEKIPKFSKKNTAKIDLMLNETTFRRWGKKFTEFK